MKNIDIDIDMVILENIDIDIDMDFLENIEIDKGILQNIDIDKILYRLEFGISNRASGKRMVLFCAQQCLRDPYRNLQDGSNTDPIKDV